jgi:hypothetical protein
MARTSPLREPSCNRDTHGVQKGTAKLHEALARPRRDKPGPNPSDPPCGPFVPAPPAPRARGGLEGPQRAVGGRLRVGRPPGAGRVRGEAPPEKFPGKRLARPGQDGKLGQGVDEGSQLGATGGKGVRIVRASPRGWRRAMSTILCSLV